MIHLTKKQIIDNEEAAQLKALDKGKRRIIVFAKKNKIELDYLCQGFVYYGRNSFSFGYFALGLRPATDKDRKKGLSGKVECVISIHGKHLICAPVAYEKSNGALFGDYIVMKRYNDRDIVRWKKRK